MDNCFYSEDHISRSGVTAFYISFPLSSWFLRCRRAPAAQGGDDERCQQYEPCPVESGGQRKRKPSVLEPQELGELYPGQQYPSTDKERSVFSRQLDPFRLEGQDRQDDQQDHTYRLDPGDIETYVVHFRGVR